MDADLLLRERFVLAEDMFADLWCGAFPIRYGDRGIG